MAFKKIRHSTISAETPEALFRDLKNREVEGLLSHQADILREYCKPEVLQASDVALQLPTGSGKTLVALLIGEWRRRRFNERVVYLCPTRQLVNQVVEQSLSKYGIKSNAFVGKQSEYSPAIKAEYTNAETLAVTTYSGLFNTNPFLNNADLIILDDAHAAENYIAKYWSLLIERDKEEHNALFKALVSAMRGIVSDEHYRRLSGQCDDIGDTQWVEKIPTPNLYDRLIEITGILDVHIKDKTDLQYSWSILRNHLFSCHIYTSYNSILIRTILPPTRTHKPFYNAKRRIYMSATLGEGGELERVSGIEKIVRLSVPEGWDKQGIGRRLFLFPERCLDEESALNLAINIIKTTPRSLVLVPDERTATEFKTKILQKIGYKIFDAAQLEQSKQPFISEARAVALVANRYEGIDLVGDECRLLIVKGLQRATNLQEKFLVTRMPAAILFKDRILTRIVQAVGRCTRAANDYAAVIVLGEELNSYLLDKDQRRFLHPEIQAELEFGNEQSKDIEEDDFLDYLRIFLEHKEEWNEAEEEIIPLRDTLQQSQLPGIDKLKIAVVHELRYQYALWNGDYEKAVEECRSALNSLSGDEVKGYRAFWYYLAGSAAWIATKNGITSLESVARDFFQRAAQTTEIRWLYELSRINIGVTQENHTDASRLTAVIERLEAQLSELGTANNTKFEAEVKTILENLDRIKDSQEDSKAFEDGHERLGRLLGYQAANSESNAAPDPYWMADDGFCIVFEDHSVNSQKSPLGATKVRQVASHPNWIKANVQLRSDAEIIPVIITPCESIEDGAKPHTSDVCYWNQKEFRAWAESAISVIRDLRRSFPGEANLEWRERAIQAYRDSGLDPASLAESLRKRRLSSLPSK